MNLSDKTRNRTLSSTRTLSKMCFQCAHFGPNLVFFGVITFLFIYPLFLPEADSFEHFMTCSKFMLTCVPLWNRENKLFMDTSAKKKKK